jgi:F-type H+-transporting ATPase subunit gamma
MEELEKLKRKIKNARELQSIVKIMKTISAANIREYGKAVESLDQYNKTITMGLQIVMLKEPKELLTVKPVKGKRRLGAVIFGSDQGLCGNFNDLISKYAIDKMNEIEHEGRTALAVGDRVVARLEEAGLPVESHFSFFGDHPGITQVMLDVLVKIEEWRAEGEIDQIVLFYNRPVSGAAFIPQMAYLFPLDIEWLSGLSEKKWPSRSLPTFSMDVNQLFSSLVRQYLFFSLYRAFVESLASENASRLRSMQLAEKNIEDHLNELNVKFHRQRQGAISSELLDIITGFEALTGEKDSSK